jgi:putative hemolysin
MSLSLLIASIPPGTVQVSESELIPAALRTVEPTVLTSTEWWMMVLLIVVGTLGAAFFAAGETGLYAVNRIRLRVRAARTSPPDLPAKILAGEIERLPSVLPAMLIGYNLFSAIGAYGLTTILDARGTSELQLILLNLFLITPILFVITDTLPKELYRESPDVLMYLSAPAIRLWRYITTYVGVLPAIRALARVVLRYAVGSRAHETAPQARAHIHSLLKEGAGAGVVSQHQLTLLDRAFGLREADVGDEMIPWSRCVTIKADWPRQRVLEVLGQKPFSRFPLVQGSRVLGIIEYVDLCLLPDAPLETLARPPVKLASSIPVRDALKSLALAESRMGIVMEAGRPIGLVTMKDLVEPLTGDLKAF